MKTLFVIVAVFATNMALMAGGDIHVYGEVTQVVVESEGGCGDVVVSQPVEDWQIITAGPQKDIVYQGQPLQKAAVAQKAQAKGYSIPEKELRKLDALERGLTRERQRNDVQDRRIGAQQTQLKKLDTRTGSIERALGALGDKTDQLSEGQRKMNASLAELSQTNESQSEKIAQHGEYLVDHEKRLMALEYKRPWWHWLILAAVIIVVFMVVIAFVNRPRKKVVKTTTKP